MKEVWVKVNTLIGLKAVKDYYSVSNTGKVMTSRGKGTLLKGEVTDKGYLKVSLTKNGGSIKKITIHRLVALAFCNGRKSSTTNQVNHVDENKLNNHYSNLEWVTAKDNINHGDRNRKVAKALMKPVESVDPTTLEVVKRYSSISQVAEDGFNPSVVGQAVAGKYSKTGKYRGLYWRLSAL